MSIHKISIAEAKNLIITAQQFNNKALTPLKAIEGLGYVQIDTLAVAERAHHHVLHTRCEAYEKSDLNDLVLSKQVFEYWSHAAAYLPMEAFRFSLVKKQAFMKGGEHWHTPDPKMKAFVMERITAEGPLRSKDFKHEKDSTAEWYEWKPAKVALEQLFMEGRLMIKQRVNFQKVYDLTERVLPKGVNTKHPTTEEYCEYLIHTALRSQGLASLPEIGYLRKGIKQPLKKSINQLVAEQKIEEVKVEGVEGAYYTLPNNVATPVNSGLQILSPFDNMTIQRKRLKDFFDFDYQIECYVPEAKRKFGYYCLPVLYNNQMVARFDPKADRKTKVFAIKQLWFEEGFSPDEDFYIQFSKKIRQLAAFCGCDSVEVLQCTPAKHKAPLMQQLKY